MGSRLEGGRALHRRDHVGSEERRAVSRPIFAHDQSPYPPSNEMLREGEHLTQRPRGRERDGPADRGDAERPAGVRERPRTARGRLRRHPRRSATRSATSVGFLPTAAPTASSASAFAAAVPADPVTIAPAWPIRLPGGASNPAM